MSDDVQVGVPNSFLPRGQPKKMRIKKTKMAHKCSRCDLRDNIRAIVRTYCMWRRIMLIN